MKLEFEYGQGLLGAELPDSTDIFIPGETVADPPCLPQDWDSLYAATLASIRNPIGMPPLKELAGPGKSVVIVIPDIVKGGNQPTSHRKVAIRACLDELYAAIGYGGMSAQKAVVRVKDEMARLDRLHAEQSAAAQEPIHPSTSNPPTVPIRGGKTSQSGIIVEGIDNCLVKFAKCCTPVPGDPVVGFITRGFGVSVHRADCPNASDAKRAEEPGRWIRVDWATGELASYQTALDISAKDRDGLTLDVAMTLSAAKVKTTSLSARSMPDGYATVSIVLEVKNQEELTNVINKLGQIQGVYQVKRASG